MTKVARRQQWQQKKDNSLIAIRDVDNSSELLEPEVYFYYVDGPRNVKDFHMGEGEFLAKFTRHPSPDELDAEWRRLAETGDHFTSSLEEKYQQKVRESEALLRSLRKCAELSLAKGKGEAK